MSLALRRAAAPLLPILLFACGGGGGGGSVVVDPGTPPPDPETFVYVAANGVIAVHLAEDLASVSWFDLGNSVRALRHDADRQVLYALTAGQLRALKTNFRFGHLVENTWGPVDLPAQLGSAGFDMAFSPQRDFLFVPGQNGGLLAAFALETFTGEPTALPGSPTALPSTATAVVAGPEAVYAACPSSHAVAAFAFDATGLTPVTGSPLALAGAPGALVLLDDGRFLAVQTSGPDRVQVFAIEPGGGLTPTGSLGIGPGRLLSDGTPRGFLVEQGFTATRHGITELGEPARIDTYTVPAPGDALAPDGTHYRLRTEPGGMASLQRFDLDADTLRTKDVQVGPTRDTSTTAALAFATDTRTWRTQVGRFFQKSGDAIRFSSFFTPPLTLIQESTLPTSSTPGLAYVGAKYLFWVDAAGDVRGADLAGFPPFPLPGPLNAPGSLRGPFHVAAHPVLPVFYVYDLIDDNPQLLSRIHVFEVDVETCAVTQHPQEVTLDFTGEMLVEPRGRFLYEPGTFGAVRGTKARRILPDGTLDSAANATISATGIHPLLIAFHPVLAYAYVVDEQLASASECADAMPPLSWRVHTFRIDATTGALVPDGTPPRCVAPDVQSLVVEPAGRFLYVSTAFAGVTVFDVQSGAPRIMTQPVLPAGTFTPTVRGPFLFGSNGYHTVDPLTGGVTLAGFLAWSGQPVEATVLISTP